MNMTPDMTRVEGEAWGRKLPTLVLEEYETGGVVRRVRIELSPVQIEDIAEKLWEMRQKYANALASMDRYLEGEHRS